MVQGTPFLLVLSLALVAPSLSASKCVLTGDWTNDLGSHMTIGAVNENGDFRGTYKTAVSGNMTDVPPSPLLGSQHIVEEMCQPTFGFTVHWKNTDTISVFTGQCFVDKDGKEVLKTMWLWRARANSIQNDWKATVVGINVFTRMPPQKKCLWQCGCPWDGDSTCPTA
ncbi:avidin [Opisthocomus hoazin]|uniref:avidin n=1 Tax=Opisthocomus hoazin TaxID=30419 RepID=UPI003F534677